MSSETILAEIKAARNRIGICQKEIIIFDQRLDDAKNIRTKYLNKREELHTFIRKQNKNAENLVYISNMNAAKNYGRGLQDFLNSNETMYAKNSMDAIIKETDNVITKIKDKVEEYNNEILVLNRKITFLEQELVTAKAQEQLASGGTNV